MFLTVGESLTAQLTDVRLVSPILGSPPRLLHEASVATVTVPKEAASPEVSCRYVFVCLLIYDPARITSFPQLPSLSGHSEL